MDSIKSLPRADGTAELLVPRASDFCTGAERAATGTLLAPKVWRDLTEAATTLDVPDPAPLG